MGDGARKTAALPFLKPIRLRAQAAALAIGALGGGAFSLAQLPAPWMLGAIAATAAASAFGAPIAPSRSAYAVGLTILGVQLGAQFEGLSAVRFGDWLVSLAALPLYLVAAASASFAVLRWLFRWPTLNAVFAASPGGAAEMAAAAAGCGADASAVILSHSFRLLFLVLSLPFLVLGGSMPAREPFAAAFATHSLQWDDLAWIGAVAFGLALALTRPSRSVLTLLIAPMFVSAAIYGVHVAAQHPPPLVGTLAQIFIGSRLGSGLSAVNEQRFAFVAVTAATLTALLLAISFVFSLMLAQWTQRDFAELMLAYAPGGPAEMALVAQAVGADPAFVVAHQAARASLILLIAAPALHAWLNRRCRTSEPKL